MKFAHFIITQFNLRSFDVSDHRAREDWEKWTERRISIFNEFCLPSVAGQAERSFIWMLFFDSETPQQFDGFISALSRYSFIRVCRVDGFEGFFREYMNEVKKLVPVGSDWLMTTRIDNDDCLHRYALKTIHQNFRERHNWLISLASGYILNKAGNTLSHYYYPMSPFITLVENMKVSADGIFQKGHTQWKQLRLFIARELFSPGKREAKFILEPLWIQVCHGENVSNSFHRGLPVVKPKDLAEFSLSRTTRAMPLSSLPKYAHYVTWKRYLKASIVKMFSKQ